MPSLRRNNVLPAAAGVILGISLAIFGYHRSTEPMTAASGVIAECSEVGAFKTSVFLAIRYTYRVAGREYEGTTRVRNTRVSDAPYRAGRELPVFFVTAAPERSYAFDRPMAFPWIAGGTILVIMGGSILLFAWNA